MNAQLPPPPFSPQHPAPPRKGTSGCLVAAMVAGGLGLLALLFLLPVSIYGVRKYLANAKAAEARNTIRRLSQLAEEAYVRDGALCPSASGPVPASISDVRRTKYLSTAAEWAVDGPKAGFACLGFSMATPQYYQYSYTSLPGSLFTVRAQGDLDGDGSLSTFEMTGRIVAGTIAMDPPRNLEIDPDE